MSTIDSNVHATANEQVRHFVDRGYLVVPNLVDTHDVERARAEAVKFAAGEYPTKNLPDDGRILAVHFPHWVSDVARDLVRHVGIVDVISRIAGAHLAHWDGSAKCMQSMLFLKPPGLPGQAWHQDERFIPTRDRSLVGAWIALDDATIENGCLWVLPDSHRAGVIYPMKPHGDPDEFDVTEQAFGDVVFFNGYLLHKSMRNNSNGTRRALVNHYMSATSMLPWTTDGGDLGAMDMRNVIHVAGNDPYAWKGYDPAPATTFVRPVSGSW
jgi:phytanoyl-CoA hydroxylase